MNRIFAKIEKRIANILMDLKIFQIRLTNIIVVKIASQEKVELLFSNAIEK